MDIERVSFESLANGGDDVTGALVKLDHNSQELADAVTGAQQVIGGLGTSATRDVGAGAGKVAAGDDPRLVARGRRNLLINGDTLVNQIVFAGGNLAANTYGYDMWRTFGAAASFARSADGTSLTLTGTIGQVIESPLLQNATLTVSLRNPTAAVTVNLRPDATSAGVVGVIPAGAGIQSVSLVVPAAMTGNVFVQLTGPASFDGPAKQGGIQLELGSFASSFERISAAEAFLQCQRYYWKSFRDSVAPANASGSLVGAISYVIPGGSGGVTYNAVRVPFPAKMRVPPALTFFNPLGPSVNWINTNLNANSGPVSIGTTGISESAAVLVNLQVAGDQPPHTICVHMIADARL